MHHVTMVICFNIIQEIKEKEKKIKSGEINKEKKI